MKYSNIATPPSCMEEQPATKILKPINVKKISLSMFVISLPLLYVSLLRVTPSNLFKDTTFWFLISNSIIVILAADSGMFFSSYDPTDNLYDEYLKRSSARGPTAATMHGPEVLNEEEECPEVIKHVQSSSSAVVVHENKSSDEPRRAQNLTSDRDDVSTVNENESSNGSTEDQNLTLTILDSLETANEINVVSKGSTKISRSRSEMAAKNRDVTRKKTFRRSATEKRSCRVDESEYWRMSDEQLNERVEDFIRKFNREIRLQEIMT